MRLERLHTGARLFCFTAAAVLCSVIGHANLLRAAPAAGTSADERAKTFKWFSSLDFPDVAKLPFIAATLPVEDEYTHRHYPPRVEVGFLVADREKEFSFFTLGRETRTVAKSAKDASPLERSGYSTADLNAYVRFVDDALDNHADKRRDSGYSPRFGEPPPYGQYLFALSWACWRKGYDSAASDLFDRAVNTYRAEGWKGHPFELISADIRQSELYPVLYFFSDEKLSRDVILLRCRRFAKNFPDCSEMALVVRTTKILERMVAEDKAHCEKLAHGKPFDKLSKHDQIAELIFQLRDQTGCQIENTQKCNIFATPENTYADTWRVRPFPDGNTAAHRLLKYGLDAVPQLVDALGDDRFCRAWEVENHGFHEFNLTIGDCAERILSRIMAHDFYPYYCMSHDGTAAKVRAAVNAWYADVLRRGEKQVLAEMAENDGNDDAAALLAEKYPSAALQPISLGLTKHANQSWMGARLIRAAAKIPGDSPIPFFQERARDADSLDQRLAAAVALVGRNQPDGAAALIREWDRIGSDDNLLFTLVLAILDSGNADAIHAMSVGLEIRPLEVRWCVTVALYQNGAADSLFGIEHGRHAAAKTPLTQRQSQAKDAILALLMNSLEDTGQKTGSYTDYFVHKSLVNPRICDVAGFDLNRFDPQRFPFDIEAPIAQRDKSRTAILNASRK